MYFSVLHSVIYLLGPFWVTDERLMMSAFTLPLVYDKTLLVIPKPGTQDFLMDQTQKVLAPFTLGLWGLVMGTIAATALFSAWFSGEVEETRTILKNSRTKPSKRRLIQAHTRVALDSCIEKSIWFCSAGIENDRVTGLSNKILMLGFAFFILIAVSVRFALLNDR